MTLTVFKAGNTWAVSVPRVLANKLDLRPGSKVEPYLVDHSIAYRSIDSAKDSALTPEFDKWLKSTAKKYGPALKKLADS